MNIFIRKVMKMPKYKLLAIDIDDTLVSKAKEVSQINKEAIARAVASGVKVVLSTGRGYYASSIVREALNLKGYVINYGGAIIMDTVSDRPVFFSQLDNSVIQDILAVADELNVHCHIYQGDEIIYEKKNPYADIYRSKLNLPSRIDPNIRKKVWSNVPKALILTEPERVEALTPMLLQRFKGVAAVTKSSPGFIEFNSIGANKGAALAKVCELLGIRREETAAIGDNTLDYEMIHWAGLGAAVSNASEVIKNIAAVIAPSCDDNGVAWFIDNYIL